MDCVKANPQLSALASGNLGDEEEAELRRHLESCEDCSFEFVKLCGRGAATTAAATEDPETEDALDVAPLAPVPDEAPAAPALEEAPRASMTGAASSAPPIAVAPLAPPTSDWTVEKIFGDGPGPSAPPQAAAAPPPVPQAPPASAPAPPPNPMFPPPGGTSFHDVALPATAPSPPPSMILPPPSAEPGPSPAAGARTAKNPGAEGWDFEPADAARDATPPEESLLFAEQALNRRIDGAGRKNTALRMVLWGGGAVIGVGLLGVSLWMAMQNQGEQPREIAARVKPTAGAATTVTHSVPGGPADDSLGVPPSVVESDPAAASEAPPNASTAAPTETPAPIKSGLAGGPAPISKPSPSAARGPTPAAVKSTPPSKTKEPAAAEKTTIAAPKPTAPKLALDDDEMWPVDDPPPAAPSAPKGSATTKPRAGSATAETLPPSSESGASASEKPAAPVEPSEMKPMDRIHAATEQAAKDEDLDALRRLKVTWRNLTRTVVGPDRSRAKREFADCLWHIQALTGRESDQREALAAYRDFLLSAPAGGADARSAARLRELEDAHSERR